MNTAEHQLIGKTLQLPTTRLAEVAGFVDFLRTREIGRALTQAAFTILIGSPPGCSNHPALNLSWLRSNKHSPYAA